MGRRVDYEYAVQGLNEFGEIEQQFFFEDTKELGPIARTYAIMRGEHARVCIEVQRRFYKAGDLYSRGYAEEVDGILPTHFDSFEQPAPRVPQRFHKRIPLIIERANNMEL
jgi:hypothetical protein